MLKRNPTCGCGAEALCNERTLDCDVCCRCIPRMLCATFLVDEGEEEDEICAACHELATLLEYSEPAPDFRPTFTGSLACRGVTATITLTLEPLPESTAEGAPCAWRVQIPEMEIDQYFEISSEGAEEARRRCRLLDPLVVEGLDFYGCVGILEIARHDWAILPLRTDCETETVEPWCGHCRCLCKVLCYRIASDLGPEYDELYELEWNPDSRKWVGEREVELIRDEYTGECLLRINICDQEIDTPLLDCRSVDIEWEAEYCDFRVTIHCKSCICRKPALIKCCTESGSEPPEVLILTALDAIDCACVHGKQTVLRYVGQQEVAADTFQDAWEGSGSFDTPCSVDFRMECTYNVPGNVSQVNLLVRRTGATTWVLSPAAAAFGCGKPFVAVWTGGGFDAAVSFSDPECCCHGGFPAFFGYDVMITE